MGHREQGSITQLGENKWLVRIEVAGPHGERITRSRTVNGGIRDAQNVRAELVNAKKKGKLTKAPKATMNTFLDDWLKNTVQNRVGSKSFQSYTQIVGIYIKPHLGKIKLEKLTPGQIQAFYNELQNEKELSPRTVRYAHTVMSNALNHAVKFGYIDRNPALLVDLPKQSKREHTVLTQEQAATFLQAIEGSRWQALFALLLFTGMRPGEALGLKWGDIDTKGKKLHIQRALVTDRTGGGWRLEEPKTATSRRTIPLGPQLLSDLRRHQWAERQAQRGDDDHLVFNDSTGTPPSLRNITRRHFKTILKKAGLPDIRLYDLRHTCATLMLMNSEHPKIVADRLGHASTTLTMDTYSHILPSMQVNATDKLEQLLTQKKHTS